MNHTEIGKLIRDLRQKQGLTQLELAEKIHVSDKTISKWERGCGVPEVSLLPKLARELGVTVETLLKGRLEENEINNGNMKKMKFYVCPDCGNLLFALDSADIYCCGKKLTEAVPQKAQDDEKLSREQIETEWFITTDHDMTREHYISFVAMLNGDTMIVKKLYPEWNLEVRLPGWRHGTLLWYCTRHGLFYQLF